jgi:soluble P-type ATPase
MIKVSIPGVGTWSLTTLVLDVNGTLAKDGLIPDKVIKKLNKLTKKLNLYFMTADTFGKIEAQKEKLPGQIIKISSFNEAEQKREFVEKVGSETVVAIGNGQNDSLMLATAKLGIAVIGPEGCALKSLLNSDIVVSSIEDAIELLITPKRIIATLRK